MISVALRPQRLRGWVCSSCRPRRVPRVPRRRWLSQAPEPSSPAAALASAPELAAAQPLPPPLPVDTRAPDQAHDDSLLRQVFDSPAAWAQFSGRAKSGLGSVGLFRNAYLTRPEGFLEFARISMLRAGRVVDRVLAARSRDEHRLVVRHQDRLSDLLCRVLDMADFVRVNHPDEPTKRAAGAAWEQVYQYMNELNTTTALNDQLGVAMADAAVSGSWSDEETAVAQVLRLDYSKSAVYLPQAHRDRFVSLSSRISSLGSEFVANMRPEDDQLIFTPEQLKGMDLRVIRRFGHGRHVFLPTEGRLTAKALTTVRDSDTRALIYTASRTASRKAVGLLEDMMRARAELASISGFESWGAMTLRDRMMARWPESVNRFLRALAASNAPTARQEMADVLEAKRRDDPAAILVMPWDRDYYAERMRQQSMDQARSRDYLPAYLSIGTVIQGLSRIFTRLFGIRFVPQEPLPGETWHPDVRRLDVFSDTEGHVAVLYCDLFYRPDKLPGCAHFTVRCSREISQAELEEVGLLRQESSSSSNDSNSGTGNAWKPPCFTSLEEDANDGMATARRGGMLKQLPTIALVCDFEQQEGSAFWGQGGPALLSFSQLQTLFHEFGHAIHSVLARTSFQNVAGTRCATDLAELPSTLMELVAADPSTLALFARHHATDAPLPPDLVADKRKATRRFKGSETERQIVLAMLDQALHSELAHRPDFDSTSIFHDLQERYSHGPHDPPSTRPHGFFSHLAGYGSTYYCYLFDEALAKRVWDVVFSAGAGGAALRRENGERLRESLLKWGGSRDPWKCLADTLGDERLAEGGEEAMELVGGWGAARYAS